MNELWQTVLQYCEHRLGLCPRQPKSAYWDERRKFRYYTEVIRLAREHAPRAKSVLDVGPNGTPLVRELKWIRSKTTIDLHPQRLRGVTCLTQDFLEYRPRRVFDLVLCLQVLEHIPAAESFAQKLLETGRTVIVSVPYRWPEGSCLQHVHDPVDEEKLASWLQRPFVAQRIVRDSRRRRLIVVVPGVGHAAARCPPEAA